MKVIILGAGGRGNVYAKYFSENGVEIAGLADPNTERLHKVANSNGIPEASLYHSWEEVLEKPKFADAVVNATTDHLHYKSTMKAIERGYHILIEKPISPSENECIEMVEAAERKNLIFAVCHVLRYAPFFEKIKELVENGAVGDILNFQLTENVGYWHFAHSFVRGVFRNEKVSSPMILAKSCHDLDIISYIMNKKCVSVMSDGGLTHFVHANKPEGAPTHCLDGCPHEKSCPYFAPKLYLTQITDVSWPTTAVTTDTSFAGRYAALQTGQYGRCVYQCDNDVADHQSAVFTMEDGSTASFNLIALSSETTRILRIYGTKGDIINRINHYIEDHIEDYNLSLTELARMTGFNPSYLSRLYRMHTGRKLSEQIDAAKLRHAQELILSGTMVKNVAERTGFASPSAFILFFKRNTGKTPRQFFEERTTTPMSAASKEAEEEQK